MQKVWTVLLLISAVIGMAVPGMATPSSSVSSSVNVDVDGSNHADSEISQVQENRGNLNNDALVVVLGGSADADSIADADASASNSGEAETEDDDSAALAGNLLSGNAIALSGEAEANGGEAENGDVIQVNAVVQLATADITTHQHLDQEVIVPVDINPDVTEIDPSFDIDVDDDSIEDSIVGNEVEDDSEIEVEE